MEISEAAIPALAWYRAWCRGPGRGTTLVSCFRFPDAAEGMPVCVYGGVGVGNAVCKDAAW